MPRLILEFKLVMIAAAKSELSSLSFFLLDKLRAGDMLWDRGRDPSFTHLPLTSSVGVGHALPDILESDRFLPPLMMFLLPLMNRLGDSGRKEFLLDMGLPPMLRPPGVLR